MESAPVCATGAFLIPKKGILKGGIEDIPMNTSPNSPDRIRGYLSFFAKRYPGAWKDFELFRAGRGKDLSPWPDWCWCPLSAAHAIVSERCIGTGGQIPAVLLSDVGTLGALGAWRMTQGIYRFDGDLFAALWSTPLTKIPTEILYKLPEWCVYIEAPSGYKIDQYALLGWFTHLEWDAATGRPELRFVFDLGGVLSPFMLHLTAATLSECVELALAESRRQAALRRGEGQPGLPPPAKTAEELKKGLVADLAPVVSVILYLCTVAADISDPRGKRERPGNPTPRKTKRGLRTFPLDGGPTTWLTGYRIGATLRLAGIRSDDASRERGAGEAGRASPRPHIRRAHWSTYWTGPRDRPQKPVLKWLPPVAVGAGEIVPTIRRVE